MNKLGLGLDTNFKPNNKEPSSSLLRNSMSGFSPSRSRRMSTKVPTTMPNSEDLYNASPREQTRFATSSSRDSRVKQNSALTIFRRFQKISHSYWLAKGKAEAESWRGDRTRSSSTAENDTVSFRSNLLEWFTLIFVVNRWNVSCSPSASRWSI